ncbi:hypothetical protein KY290_001171 [Solanum tuberosum]|uniref:Retrotransposon gag domain-containing protein n=1 Tax=Solanum tuberosum TaxID=4113 RepID=A0ABQ7WNC7_SOLTU|nr:hypothetical protein KY290_001171 [Solanum tuberosum]
MVNTRTNASHSEPIMPTPDLIGQQLTTIAAKLEAIGALAADVAALKAQNMQNQHGKSKVLLEEGEVDSTWRHQETYQRSHTKMEFPKYEGGDPRGWILKAEKYFQNYQTPNDCKDELMKVMQENYGPAEFQNPDEHLCSIQQTGSVFEYRQELAKRAACVQTWPEHCLLGVFLSGLREDLRVDVRIHKPRSVYKAMSLALEYEGKQGLNQSSKSSLPNTCPLNSEQQIRREKGLCYRCGDKFTPGHRCKPGNFAQLELMQEENHVQSVDGNQNEDIPPTDLGEISFHAILGKEFSSTLKLQGTLCGHKVLMLVDSGSTHNFVAEEIVTKLGLVVQYIPTFGVQIGNDLEEQMLTRDAMLNLMKADYKHIDLSSNVGDASIFRLQSYGQQSLLAAKFPDFRLEDKSSFQEGCTDKARIFRTYSRRKKRRQIGEDNDLHLLKFLEVSPMEQ